MGLRFRRSINLGGGFRLNLSKKGIGMSAGVKGFRVSTGPRGVTKTVSIPGTGLSYSSHTSVKKRQVNNHANNQFLYDLPDGVYIPKVKSNVYGYILSGILFTIIGAFFPLLILVALILLFIGIKNMLFDKQFKSSLNTQLSIQQYQKGNFDMCVRYAQKALKYDANNEPAKILLSNLSGNTIGLSNNKSNYQHEAEVVTKTAQSNYSHSTSYDEKRAALNKSVSLNKRIRNFLPDSFVVIDFETTGLDSVTDKIIELGAVKYMNGEFKGEFSTLINPGITITPYITSINGITNAMVKDAPKISEKLPEFVDFLEDLPIVAHNASFDMKFLKSNALDFDIEILNPFIDTLYLCRKLYPDFEDHKLGTICSNLCIEQDTAHRSLADCMSTAKVYLKCREYEVNNRNSIYGTGTQDGAETTEFELAVFEKIKELLQLSDKSVEHLDYIDTKKNFSIVCIGSNDTVYEIAKFTIGTRKKYFSLVPYGRTVFSVNKLSKLIQEEYTYELDANNNVKLLFSTVEDLTKYSSLFIQQYDTFEKMFSRYGYA